MNTKTIKKMAEVEAFLMTSRSISDRAGQSFEEAAAEVNQALRRLAGKSVREHIPEQDAEVFEDKVAKTNEKLAKMMELYIGDEWDNPTEVLEWSSFFTGAAAAHCAVAGGLAAKDGNEAAAEQLSSLQGAYRSLLDDVISQLGGSH